MLSGIFILCGVYAREWRIVLREKLCERVDTDCLNEGGN